MSKKKSGNMSDHIEEYFAEQEGKKEAIQSRELFHSKDENIDLKTDLTDEEISLINTMLFNDRILKEKGLKQIYSKYIIKFMRLKVSRERQSRKEFVSMNQGIGADNEDMQEQLNKNLENLTKTRK